MRAANLLFILISLLLVSAYADARQVQSTGSRLFFVFNQPGYAPGDTAYFTGYLLPGENQLVRNKQIVSIKLLGPEGEVIHHARIMFQDGVGNSQIIISQSMTPGNYEFVAYAETSSIKENALIHQGYINISSREKLILDDQPISTQQENDSSIVKIAMNRNYSRRSKVTVSVTPVDNKSSLTSVSMAVYNEQLFNDRDKTELLSTAQTLKVVSENDKRSASSISQDLPNYFIGQAVITSSGAAVPDSSKITFYLNESDFAYVVYTRAGGNFSFPLFNPIGSQEVFYRISYRGKRLEDSQIILQDASLAASSVKSLRSDSLNAYGIYAKQKQFIERSYHYFAAKQRNDESGNIRMNDLETDSEILLDQFEPFPSMAEVFANVVPSVRYKKNDNDERIRVFLKSSAKYGDHDPVYIVNGMMTDDTKYVMSLDPKLVRRIGVLRSDQTLARFGDLGSDGILIIETDRTKNKQHVSNLTNSLSVIGISSSLEYKKTTHTHDQINSRVPDLRPCLYWNPKADLNKISTFDFYTSDVVGHYIIQITGLLDGKPFLVQEGFSVTQRVDE